MPELDPDIVGKVDAGDTLPNVARQIFLGMAEGNLSPEAIREARSVSLIRKHMDGGRLTQSERDEVAHVLNDAAFVTVETTATTAATTATKKASLTQDEIESIYQISRAKFFRWKQQGQAVAGGPDPPPFDDPKGMIAWYERMRERGIFKHQIPRLLKDVAAKGIAAIQNERKSPADASKPATPSSNGNGVTPSFREAPENRGFLVELEKLEEHTAVLREDYQAAYESGDNERGAMLKTRYFDALDLLRKSAAQKEAIGLAEKSLVKKNEVIEVQEPIVKSVVKNLVAPPALRRAYDELGLAEKGVTLEAFVVAITSHVKTCFADLVRSNFAPPLMLDAA